MTSTTRTFRLNPKLVLCILGLFVPRLSAAPDPSVQTILDRLDHLEQQNQTMREALRVLRNQVAALRATPTATAASQPPEAPAPEPTMEERLSVIENRVEEQAQTKVEASQRFPIRVTGMALVNAFSNSPHNGGSDNPTIASLVPGPRTSGGAIRQSVIGLEFRGPSVAGGGKVSGSLFMDFHGGPGDSLNQFFRLRTGSINFDWRNSSIMIGQDKPIVSPREPNSIAQVGVSPLTNAGNLWLWQPQISFEQRFTLGEGTRLRARAGVYQTREAAAIVPPGYAGTLEQRRPAFQGRLEISHRSPTGFQIVIAPGVHAGATHVAGASVPSRMVSVDWFLKPAPKFEFSGMFFRGKNVAGMGALRQGFQIVAPGQVRPVHSIGGWAQLTFLATRRLTFNLFGGQQDDRNSNLPIGGFGKNQAYGGNIMLRIAPNVILSLENLQTWTTYVGQGTRRNNHYDLGVAYLF